MRTWAEIDLTALEHNYRTLRAMLPTDLIEMLPQVLKESEERN